MMWIVVPTFCGRVPIGGLVADHVVGVDGRARLRGVDLHLEVLRRRAACVASRDGLVRRRRGSRLRPTPPLTLIVTLLFFLTSVPAFGFWAITVLDGLRCSRRAWSPGTRCCAASVLRRVRPRSCPTTFGTVTVSWSSPSFDRREEDAADERGEHEQREHGEGRRVAAPARRAGRTCGRVDRDARARDRGRRRVRADARRSRPWRSGARRRSR